MDGSLSLPASYLRAAARRYSIASFAQTASLGPAVAETQGSAARVDGQQAVGGEACIVLFLSNNTSLPGSQTGEKPRRRKRTDPV